MKLHLTPAAPVAALALAILVAACGGSAPVASPTPADPSPTPAPTGTPVLTPVPTDAPSPAPSDVPQGDAGVQLDVADSHDVVVVVTDRGAGLAGAESGKARDGMSVRWGDAIVKNLGPKTIEVTWVGFAKDATIGLVVEQQDDGVLLRFGQEAPYENTDALGADRVMVFTFDHPVSADQVAVEFTTADD